MIALRLVRLIETHCDDLTEKLVKKLLSDSHTSDLRKVPKSELRDRIHELLQHLSDWLLNKTPADIESKYISLGKRRCSQGVSVADFSWSFMKTKEHLWAFLQREGFLLNAVELYGELELLRLLDQFFDRALCFAMQGYELQGSPDAVRNKATEDAMMAR
jgi:hypothetical protein